MFIEGKRIGMEEASNRPLYYNMLACRARTDAAAFSELYDYFFPRTYNFIYGRTKNRDAADEIISIVFEKLFLHLADYEAEKAAFSTWLFRIAQNAIHDFYRRQGARHEDRPPSRAFDDAGDRFSPLGGAGRLVESDEDAEDPVEPRPGFGEALVEEVEDLLFAHGLRAWVRSVAQAESSSAAPAPTQARNARAMAIRRRSP